MSKQEKVLNSIAQKRDEWKKLNKEYDELCDEANRLAEEADNNRHNTQVFDKKIKDWENINDELNKNSEKRYNIEKELVNLNSESISILKNSN